ncbi:DUF7268 family protein [Halobacterium bonnevillei]|uniref:Uncharacterized protein n=1 Tax=Halobacterium bonnevillei TaxID=2692200 RepID=A0A6B0SUS8_9EURY|nr:hypothetical protein [Halobacterium bonnevillei]MXR21299.1 hypothetical protein [Halobacterium bonnevillei]
MTDSSVPSSRPRAERYRALVVGALRWVAVGAVLGTGVSLALLTIWSPKGATDTAFALGALVLGFGVTAWSSAVGLGRTIEGMQERLNVSSGWTEASAREAFFVLSWTGAGWVVAAALTSIALGV